ncbi:MAG TPA: prolyl aminopeptidase [Burkholderiales bacterium]|nr:prolyl aminopeptidase [Burkholderiales bacterium]
MDQNQASGEVLYPAIEPYRKDWLAVGGGHQVYFEESGNPEGFPVLFVHGGPGSRTRPPHRRFFDPAFYRIVLFDQRGCGQSAPAGSIFENTTSHLVADIEQLRHHLGVDRWLLFGGSWGSTLCLAYATAHADRVAGMVLRGVFLGSATEVEWYVSGIRRFVPEAWADFAGDAGESVIEHYRQRIDHPETSVALAAARRWSNYETRIMAIGEMSNGGDDGRNGATDEEMLAGARIQLHFLAHQCFLRPNQLLDDLWRIGNKPVTLVQGRMDMVCPPISAFEVSRRLAGADLRLVPNGGHSAMQPAVAAELCAATARMRDLLGNSR